MPQYERRPSAPVVSTLSNLKREEKRRPSAVTMRSFDKDKVLPPTPLQGVKDLKEQDMPEKIHAFMKGLVERASRGNLRKDREDAVSRTGSPFVRLRGM